MGARAGWFALASMVLPCAACQAPPIATVDCHAVVANTSAIGRTVSLYGRLTTNILIDLDAQPESSMTNEFDCRPARDAESSGVTVRFSLEQAQFTNAAREANTTTTTFLVTGTVESVDTTFFVLRDVSVRLPSEPADSRTRSAGGS